MKIYVLLIKRRSENNIIIKINISELVNNVKSTHTKSVKNG